jgi:hypothetical protein
LGTHLSIIPSNFSTRGHFFEPCKWMVNLGKQRSLEYMSAFEKRRPCTKPIPPMALNYDWMLFIPWTKSHSYITAPVRAGSLQKILCIVQSLCQLMNCIFQTSTEVCTLKKKEIEKI